MKSADRHPHDFQKGGELTGQRNGQEASLGGRLDHAIPLRAEKGPVGPQTAVILAQPPFGSRRRTLWPLKVSGVRVWRNFGLHEGLEATYTPTLAGIRPTEQRDVAGPTSGHYGSSLCAVHDLLHGSMAFPDAAASLGISASDRARPVSQLGLFEQILSDGTPLSELSWSSSLVVVAVSFSGLFTFIFLMLACLCCKKGGIGFKSWRSESREKRLRMVLRYLPCTGASTVPKTACNVELGNPGQPSPCPLTKARLGYRLEAVALAMTCPVDLRRVWQGMLYLFCFRLLFQIFVSMEHLFSFGENLKLAVMKYIRINHLGLCPEPSTAFPHMHRSVGGKIKKEEEEKEEEEEEERVTECTAVSVTPQF
ncbi:serine/threonine-protein kinase LMTK1 [Crotalus adamanteus]|uniref:Serine/threonine-protein kinase LMTK1 n=1 Tax=Crotalus adamanteus TaxID=8729 RepID=A0AAW1BYD4_CROAD